VERLRAEAQADPALIRALLRDGLPAPMQVEGLQRQLLRRRDRFSAQDFAKLCARISQLCALENVPSDDFRARCAEEPPAAELNIARQLSGPTLAAGYYLEPEGALVSGVAVNLDELINSTRAQ